MRAAIATAAIAALTCSEAAPLGTRMKNGVDGWSALPQRVRAALRKRGLQADSDGLAWTSDHHDTLNSGQTVAVGPADSPGSCRASFFKASADCTDANGCSAASTARYFATGVGSSDNQDNKDYFYFGGTDNVLRVISGSARVATAIDTWTCNITKMRPSVAPGTLPVVDYGIVSSPAAWDVAGQDRLAVASGDGFLYVLDMAGCLADENVCSAASNGKVGSTTGAGQAGHLRSLGQASTSGVTEGASCLRAAYNLPARLAGLSAPRYLTPAQSNTATGLILVVASDPLLTANDVLVALPGLASGTSVTPAWTFNPATAGFGPVSLRGVVPALSPNTPAPMLYVPVGRGIAVLNSTNGAVLTSYVNATTIDPLVSSTVLSEDGLELYVHGSTGTLFKFSVTVTQGGRNVTLAPAWACDYTQANFEAKTDPCFPVLGGHLPVPGPKEYGVVARSASTGRVSSKPAMDLSTGKPLTRVASKGDLAFGGRPRALETASEVQQLYSDIRAAYEAVNGLGSADAAVAGTSSPHEAASTLASSLPLATLAGLGLVVLEGDGLTASPISLGDYPYATPAMLNGDSYIVVPQYITPGVGATGLFVADSANGQTQWAFFGHEFEVGGFSITLPLGRSRSSPAVDGEGAVYVGADIDWPFAEDPQGNDTMPTLFAFSSASGVPGDPQLNYTWSWNMGSEADVPLGSASPVVRVGIYADREVLMTAFEGAVSITEGALCKTDIPETECSNHGVCDCAVGVCECEECWGGEGCGVYDKSCDSAAAKPLDPETIGAAVGLPVGLLLLGAGFWAVRRAKARRSWAALLPASVSGRLGLSQPPAYTEVALMPVTTAGGAAAGYGSASGGAGQVKDWSAKK